LKRKAIIHKHIFKNAGSTFDWILKENLGNAFCDHRDDIPMKEEGYSYLLRFLKENPQILALSSHHLMFQFKTDAEIEFIPVYLIRHPIERIRSVYNFERIQKSDSIGAIMAKQMNFNDYVLWRMQEDTQPTIRNFHTKFLAGEKPAEICNEKSLQKARNELISNRFIGIVDKFSLSMKYFENEFANIGIHLNLTKYESQNVLQDVDNININKRVEEILNDLGVLSDLVIEKNNYDIYVYNYACELLEKRFANV
jgi:hypothetical protein